MFLAPASKSLNSLRPHLSVRCPVASCCELARTRSDDVDAVRPELQRTAPRCGCTRTEAVFARNAAAWLSACA